MVTVRGADRPYPSHWNRELILRDGTRVPVRPIRPDDESKILELLQNVSKEDLRLRFFDSIKEFTHEFVVRVTQLDYSRAMAFVALDETGDVILGVVRLHRDVRERRVCDFAQIEPEGQGTWLGSDAIDDRLCQVRRYQNHLGSNHA
jgi:hypothetical protein